MNSIVRKIRKLLRWMPDKLYLQIMYFYHFKKFINFKHPLSFNEKLQWLKIHDRKPEYTIMVDKIEAKDYVAKIIGKQYIIPTIAVYDSISEIDVGKLPEQFVMKCNHDSKSVFICKSKKMFDFKNACSMLHNALQRNGYYYGREWPYKRVNPRILVEKYMGDDLIDYKIQCFHGKVNNIMACVGRNTNKGPFFYYFDREWNYLPYSKQIDPTFSDYKSIMPKSLDEMIVIAERLSKGLIQLRVDLYEINGAIYFGELTFFSQSGFDTTITQEADLIMGQQLKLPS